MKKKTKLSLSLLAVTVAGLAGSGVGKGPIRPNTGADQSIGADQAGNVGAPIRNPATTPGPNAEPSFNRDPVRRPPETLSEREKRQKREEEEATKPFGRSITGASGNPGGGSDKGERESQFRGDFK